MITFNLVNNGDIKHLGLVVGYSYTMENNVIYIKDKAGITTAIFNNASIEEQGEKYCNIYI